MIAKSCGFWSFCFKQVRKSTAERHLQGKAEDGVSVSVWVAKKLEKAQMQQISQMEWNATNFPPWCHCPLMWRGGECSVQLHLATQRVHLTWYCRHHRGNGPVFWFTCTLPHLHCAYTVKSEQYFTSRHSVWHQCWTEQQTSNENQCLRRWWWWCWWVALEHKTNIKHQLQLKFPP